MWMNTLTSIYLKHLHRFCFQHSDDKKKNLKSFNSCSDTYKYARIHKDFSVYCIKLSNFLGIFNSNVGTSQLNVTWLAQLCVHVMENLTGPRGEHNSKTGWALHSTQKWALHDIQSDKSKAWEVGFSHAHFGCWQNAPTGQVLLLCCYSL